MTYRTLQRQVGYQRAKRNTLPTFLDEQIRIKTDDCIVWPFAKYKNGYGQIRVNGRLERVHRLALIKTQGEPPEDKKLALHGDCHNRACFNPRHLYWGSYSQNAYDKRRDGTDISGEKHPFSKVTKEMADKIRKEDLSKISYKQMAEKYNVSDNCIWRVRKRGYLA